MTVRIELKPEVEANIAAQAQARGLSVEDYLQRVIEDQAGVQPNDPGYPERLMRALDRLAEMGKDLPPLPSSALTRESIYQDHD
jgi:hypothetical protein